MSPTSAVSFLSLRQDSLVIFNTTLLRMRIISNISLFSSDIRYGIICSDKADV